MDRGGEMNKGESAFGFVALILIATSFCLIQMQFKGAEEAINALRNKQCSVDQTPVWETIHQVQDSLRYHKSTIHYGH